MIKVLITGITGYISQYLLKSAPGNMEISGTIHSTQTEKEHHKYSLIPLDLSQPIAKQLASVNVDLVIHTAANSNLAQCEEDPEMAYRVNSQATSELADWCYQSGTKLIYLSTDIVFDGENAPYSEQDKPAPINIYGESKYRGEQAVLRYEDFSIVRLALVLGQGLGAKKNFVDWIIGKIDNNEEIPLFHDEIRTPAPAINVTKALWKIALENGNGIFHISTDRNYNRIEIGKEIINYYQKGYSNIKETSLKDIPGKRPVDVSLLNRNLYRKYDLKFSSIKIPELFKGPLNE